MPAHTHKLVQQNMQAGTQLLTEGHLKAIICTAESLFLFWQAKQVNHSFWCATKQTTVLALFLLHFPIWWIMYLKNSGKHYKLTLFTLSFSVLGFELRREGLELCKESDLGLLLFIMMWVVMLSLLSSSHDDKSDERSTKNLSPTIWSIQSVQYFYHKTNST